MRVDGAHGLVRELAESTLHEGDDRRVIPVDRSRSSAHRQEFCPLDALLVFRCVVPKPLSIGGM
ncbi:hypothetical protein AV929_13390 [Haloarcula sp. K1]|nr:hypothetical protein AV929_13390 [Haloarcula sp. K1]